MFQSTRQIDSHIIDVRWNSLVEIGPQLADTESKDGGCAGAEATTVSVGRLAIARA